MFVLLRKWKSRELNMNSSDNTVPPLEAFWAIHDQAYYDPQESDYICYPAPDPRYVELSTGVASHPTDRRYSYLLVKDLETETIWGVQIWKPGSWTEEYKDLYVRGPFRMNVVPRIITVFDYVEVEDDLDIKEAT